MAIIIVAGDFNSKNSPLNQLEQVILNSPFTFQRQIMKNDQP